MNRAISSVLAAAAMLSACASSPEAETPAWFEQRQAELDAQGAPPLQGIPRGTIARTEPGYWNNLDQDLAAAEAAMKAHPRATPPGDAAANAAAAEAEEAAARAALEATASQY